MSKPKSMAAADHRKATKGDDGPAKHAAAYDRLICAHDSLDQALGHIESLVKRTVKNGRRPWRPNAGPQGAVVRTRVYVGQLQETSYLGKLACDVARAVGEINAAREQIAVFEGVAAEC